MPLPATGKRVIRHELLDDQPPGAGDRSLRDLVRINRYLGGHAVLLRTIKQVLKPDEHFSFLDIGAASGDMGRALLDRYPNARITCLDYRRHHLNRASRPAVQADAFRLPFRRGAFDVVHCSLFLHHFPDAQVTELLQGFSAAARRYVILTDLERHPLAYYFLPATRWLFRWDPLTVHDGPISVAAAFRQDELLALARRAGLSDALVTTYRPAFRIALIASAPTGTDASRPLTGAIVG